MERGRGKSTERSAKEELTMKEKWRWVGEVREGGR